MRVAKYIVRQKTKLIFILPPMEEADLVVEQPGGGSSKGETKVL